MSYISYAGMFFPQILAWFFKEEGGRGIQLIQKRENKKWISLMGKKELYKTWNKPEEEEDEKGILSQV